MANDSDEVDGVTTESTGSGRVAKLHENLADLARELNSAGQVTVKEIESEFKEPDTTSCCQCLKNGESDLTIELYIGVGA